MLQIAAALAAGLLFGAGLAVSRMVDPAKVLGFLDIAGDWDPSLAFVLAGAAGTAALGFRLVLGHSTRVRGHLCNGLSCEPLLWRW